MRFVMLFVALSIINVFFSTVRSILTIKGGKIVAALTSAGYFAFYNVMVIYTVADFPMWQKCLTTFVCNLIGVYTVKLLEEKLQKDKLWKVEVSIPTIWTESVDFDLYDIPHYYLRISNKHTTFCFFCSAQAETKRVKEVCSQYQAKFFASENKFF